MNQVLLKIIRRQQIHSADIEVVLRRELKRKTRIIEVEKAVDDITETLPSVDIQFTENLPFM